MADLDDLFDEVERELAYPARVKRKLDELRAAVEVLREEHLALLDKVDFWKNRRVPAIDISASRQRTELAKRLAAAIVRCRDCANRRARGHGTSCDPCFNDKRYLADLG